MATTAMGDEGGYGDELPSADVEVKTATPDANKQFNDQSKQEVVSFGGANVLNGYRSVTYNFTIAALDNTDLKNPESYRDSELKFVVLKSGGKGPGGMSSSPSEQASRLATDNPDEDPRIKRTVQADAKASIKYNEELVTGFNKESPGRFDMYINDVTIETIMTTNETSNSTLPTKIKFDVIEPYSINGFIEALHVAAIASGYTSYLDACFLLKMEFWGYPDAGDFSEPVLIKNSERYFPFGLTEVGVDITESGTRYQCSAVPYNERAFGQTNKIKKPIKMEGATVQEILENLFKGINEQVRDSIDKSNSSNSGYDEYVIKFPSVAPTGEFVDTVNTKIASKKLTELLKDNALYAMAEPGDTQKPNAYQADDSKKPTAEQQAKQPESIKYTPGKTIVNFPQDININDAISAVVRDSDYVKDILKNIGKKPDCPDQYGFLEYFMIQLNVVNKTQKNEAEKRNYQIYTYQIVPYKIHYTRIPGYGQSIIKEEDLKKISHRTYNYLYTGQNVDVLTFKLNFNTLFFEAVPAAMGNKDTVASKSAAAPGNNVEIKNNTSDPNLDAKDRRLMNQVPQHPVKVISTPVTAYGGNATQPKDDPYSVMARYMHDSVVNSKASMISGEMDILGDPFYIATGGIGNYNPKSGAKGTTEKDEADHCAGSTLITINFRNPIDFNSFENGGMAQFDNNRVPFSGVYQVLQAVSTFKDGVFKQKLNIIRMPGQVLDSNLRASDPADKQSTIPNKNDTIVPDNTRSVAPSQRADSDTVNTQLNRGLPSTDNNFTNASGGLGGAPTTLLNQTAGQITNQFSQASSIVGQTLPGAEDALSNIRLQSSGLVNLSQQSLGSASVIAAASNVLTGNLPIERAAGMIGGALANSAINAARNIANIGSGIGKGATVSIDSTIPAIPTMNEITRGLDISSIKLPTDSISNVNSIISNNSINAVTGIGAGANSLVGGVGDKINALTASLSDPQSIAAKVGLDSSKLSGLSGLLQSKLPTQITGMINSIPSNVNLTQAASAGLVLDYIPADKIKNIPATAPYATAPVAKADPAYASEVVQRGGTTALENLYGVNSVSELSTNVVPAELINESKNVRVNSFVIKDSYLNTQYPPDLDQVDETVGIDKLASVKSQLSGITGQVSIPDSNVVGSVSNKFGSLESSPLDKLVNKFNG